MEETRSLVDHIKYHVADTTAILIAAHPAFTAIEVGIAGMSDEVSISTRLVATAVNYGGLGFVYSWGRRKWRERFRITQESSEVLQAANDFVYSALFSLPVSPMFYLAGGERDPENILIGTAVGAIYSGVIGLAAGPLIDSFRDLVGLEECNRRFYPISLRGRLPKTKKILATGLVAATLSAMALMYRATDDEPIAPTHEVSSDLEVITENLAASSS